MIYDYIIKNGRVIDPASSTDSEKDIYIKGTHIADSPKDGETVSGTVIDASGCLVVPGLIDFHTHLGYQMSDFGLNPDLYTLPNGVTSAVDAGSGGTANFEGMYTNIFTGSMIDIRCFLNIAATGIITERYTENLDPERVDEDKIHYLIERYGDVILGFKVRTGKNTSGSLGLKPLEKAVELGRKFNKRVCLHATNLENSYEEILSVMRTGDVICHIFQGDNENCILDENGRVSESVIMGRQKGVLYDCACGRVNYSNRVMRQAFEEGFYPDIISTDVIGFSIYGPKIHSLLSVLSHYLALGVPLMRIIKACTYTPAGLMRIPGVTGELKAGSQADIFITRLTDSNMVITDKFGESVSVKKVFEPLMTIKAGKPAYRSILFDRVLC